VEPLLTLLNAIDLSSASALPGNVVARYGSVAIFVPTTDGRNSTATCALHQPARCNPL
jgi:hypothetical protein